MTVNCDCVKIIVTVNHAIVIVILGIVTVNLGIVTVKTMVIVSIVTVNLSLQAREFARGEGEGREEDVTMTG